MMRIQDLGTGIRDRRFLKAGHEEKHRGAGRTQPVTAAISGRQSPKTREPEVRKGAEREPGVLSALGRAMSVRRQVGRQALEGR